MEIDRLTLYIDVKTKRELNLITVNKGTKMGPEVLKLIEAYIIKNKKFLSSKEAS